MLDRLFTEMKLVGDSYPGGFICGMSMHNSQTMENFKKVSSSDSEDRYENEKGLVLRLEKEKDGEALRVRTVVANHGTEPVSVEFLTTFGLKSNKIDTIHRLQSFWSAEGKLRTEKLTDLHLEVSWNRCGTRIEKFGNVGSMPVRKYFPFLALEDSESGTFTAVQLYCASSWQMELLVREDDTVTLTAGLADRDFGQWMKVIEPGESFTTPDAVIAQGSSLYEVCDKLVKAQHPAISPVDNKMGILFNEYCTTWGNPSFENVKRIADTLEGKGIQFLVIDSGWYGQSDYWWDYVGDWDVNQKKFPGGMKPIADYIRSKGMVPGLWYEMESVVWKSKYYNAAEHLVKKDGVPLTVGGRRFFDMEDPWVVEYLSEKVIKLLKESGFGYLKVDYNDTMGMGCDGHESIGEGLRRKVAASQAFFRRIREAIPDIVIENCSSGGHRLEPSMMELVSQASFSDAHEITSIPIIAANMHRVIKPSQSQIWAVLRGEDSDNRIYYSLISTMFGRMCLSGDIYNLNAHQWQLVEEGMNFYEKAAEIIEKGVTVFRLEADTAYNNPRGQQMVVREYGDKGLVIVHRFAESEEVQPLIPAGATILAQYGSAEEDFSAKAWIYRR